MHALIAQGALVEVLPDLACEAMSIWLLHGHGSRVPKSVRAAMKWIAEIMGPFVEAEARRAP